MGRCCLSHLIIIVFCVLYMHACIQELTLSARDEFKFVCCVKGGGKHRSVPRLIPLFLPALSVAVNISNFADGWTSSLEPRLS